MGNVGIDPVIEEMCEFYCLGNCEGVYLGGGDHALCRKFIVGGLVLGIAESMTTGYLSGNYEDVLSFCLLILILIFRPDGILGKKQVQKV